VEGFEFPTDLGVIDYTFLEVWNNNVYLKVKAKDDMPS
jgi:hypothetical protein